MQPGPVSTFRARASSSLANFSTQTTVSQTLPYPSYHFLYSILIVLVQNLCCHDKHRLHIKPRLCGRLDEKWNIMLVLKLLSLVDGHLSELFPVLLIAY